MAEWTGVKKMCSRVVHGLVCVSAESPHELFDRANRRCYRIKPPSPQRTGIYTETELHQSSRTIHPTSQKSRQRQPDAAPSHYFPLTHKSALPSNPPGAPKGERQTYMVKSSMPFRLDKLIGGSQLRRIALEMPLNRRCITFSALSATTVNRHPRKVR